MKQRLSKLFWLPPAAATAWLARHCRRPPTQQQYEYALFSARGFWRELTKTLLLLALAAPIGLLWQAAALFAAYGLLRTLARGLHLNSFWPCFFLGFTYIVGGALLSSILQLPLAAILPIFAAAALLFARYAPAATPGRQILPSVRPLLKAASLAALAILAAVATILSLRGMGQWATLITFAAIFQCIDILPVTYRLFKIPY